MTPQPHDHYGRHTLRFFTVFHTTTLWERHFIFNLIPGVWRIWREHLLHMTCITTLLPGAFRLTAAFPVSSDACLRFALPCFLILSLALELSACCFLSEDFIISILHTPICLLFC